MVAAAGSAQLSFAVLVPVPPQSAVARADVGLQHRPVAQGRASQFAPVGPSDGHSLVTLR